MAPEAEGRSDAPHRGRIPDPLNLRLDEIIRSARLAWPTVKLLPEQFVAHLGRHLPAGIPVEVALGQMATEDLYLARACGLGDDQAILAFEQSYVHELESVLAKYTDFSDLTAEVKQRVRTQLLVGDAGPPRIESFSGRGNLRGWVRVIAVREAVALLRRAQREIPVDDDALLQSFVSPGDGHLEQVKARYVAEFKQAFSEALRGLSARERTLLRQHVIDRLSIDRLGALYRMHRATIARSLQRVRRELLEATREHLALRLDVESSELDSILGLIRSRFEITLRWLVRGRRNHANHATRNASRARIRRQPARTSS